MKHVEKTMDFAVSIDVFIKLVVNGTNKKFYYVAADDDGCC